MATTHSAGYFGKIPTQGDFMSRRLPRQFIELWDGWLQQGLSKSQKQLKDQWLDKYLNCPVWWFGLSAGLCDDNDWLGVIIPSVDRVGRYFPLTIAAPFPPVASAYFAMVQADEWMRKVENIALYALNEQFDLQHFHDLLDDLGDPNEYCAPPPLFNAKLNAMLSQTLWRFSAHDPLTTNMELTFVNEQLIKGQNENYSIWKNGQAKSFVQSTLLCRNLPAPDTFAALLDGQWKKWGWGDWADVYT